MALSSGRCNLMPGLMVQPTELRLNVLTQNTTSAIIHSSLAYTFSTAVHIALSKQSQLLPPLCSNTSQVSPLTQSSQGAVSLLSSGQLPLRSPVLPATFSLTVFPPKQLSCYSSNIPDPFSPQGLYSYHFTLEFVSSSCKGLSPASKCLALISLKCLAKCPFLRDIHPDYPVQMCNPHLNPSLPNPCILAYFSLWHLSPFNILCIMTSLLYLL